MTRTEKLLAVLTALPAGEDLALVRRGEDWVLGVDPAEVFTASGVAALDGLDGLARGWWAGWLAYDLGRAVERVRSRLPDDPGLPDVALARFDARLVIGPAHWRVEGQGPGVGRLVRLAQQAASRAGEPGPARHGEPGAPDLWSSSLSASAYRAGVETIIALIEAGECYQVNLTRCLSSAVPADPVRLFAALVRRHPAPGAALLRIGAAAVVSASPEVFLRRRGALIETRPIKGTAAERAVLAESAKDRAENVMITDLARNDLGRVCVPGSITVPALCRLEAHPGLWHLVSTVTGRLRPGTGTGALIRATFPPASVTGAPKPKVLQVIEDLEPVRRGVYCGAVGWIDTAAGEADLSVAIRTFVLRGGRTRLGVGAGITAGSDPEAEWRETELKAARLIAAARDAAPALVGMRAGGP